MCEPRDGGMRTRLTHRSLLTGNNAETTSTAAPRLLTLGELLLRARHWYYHHSYLRDDETEAQQGHELE